MTSFDGVSFKELTQDSTYPTWSKSGNTLIKNIPGGSKNVIQKVGTDLPRLAMPVQLTAAQLASLKTKAEAATVGTLIFQLRNLHSSATECRQPCKLSALITTFTPRLSTSFAPDRLSTTPTTAILAENSNPLITEASEYFIQE
jgi:hypothetical protein